MSLIDPYNKKAISISCIDIYSVDQEGKVPSQFYKIFSKALFLFTLMIEYIF